MKVLLLNGSPRNGNTCTALKTLKKGLENVEGLEICEIAANHVNVSPCLACEYCKEHGICICDDDTNVILNAILDANVIIFATPIYWWGITAQLKIILDKFYSRTAELGACKKQIGIIAVGQLPVENIQYQLVSKQFTCICEYLGWDIIFNNAYSAHKVSDLRSHADSIAEIHELWMKIKK